MHGRSLRILQPCSSHTLAGQCMVKPRVSGYQNIDGFSLSTLASIPNRYYCWSLEDQLDSLAEVVLQNRRGLDLLTAEKGGLCLFINEECCFYVNQSEIVRDILQQLREQIIKKREKLPNSWGNWNNIWSWASWLFPLTSPLMFFVALLFGPCMLNAITQFITSQIESIKLQMIITQYSPLNEGEL